MIITRDSDGYITNFYTYEDLMANREVLLDLVIHPDLYTECPNFPDDRPAAWSHFQEHYRDYTFQAVPPEYWEEHYGEGYVITSDQILEQFTYHPEHAS